MLPRIHTQHRRHVQPTGALPPRRMWSERTDTILHLRLATERLRTQPAQPPDILRIHIHRLQPGVRLRIGAPRDVGAEQPELARARPRLDEPDEARAEHGLGRREHLVAQRGERAEGGDQRLGEVGRDAVAAAGGAAGDEGVEEEVVVVRHAGVVEEGGLVRVPRVGEEEVFHVFGFFGGAYVCSSVGFSREFPMKVVGKTGLVEFFFVPTVRSLTFWIMRPW